MKIKTLIIIALFCPSLLKGQEKLSNNKFSFGPSILPEYSALIFFPDFENKFKSVPKIGICFGLNLKYRLKEKIHIRTGIAYGIKRYNYLTLGLRFPTDIDPVGPGTTSEIEKKNYYKELQIPIICQVNLRSPKYYFATGIEYLHTSKNISTAKILYGNGEQEKLSGSSSPAKSDFAFILGLGSNLKIREKVQFNIEPMIKLYYTKYNENAHLCNFGLRTTFYFKK